MKIAYFKLENGFRVNRTIIEVKSDLDTFHELVGGYIEVFPLTDRLLVVLDEEGKIKGKEPSAVVLSVVLQIPEIIVGDFFVCRREGEDFASIKDEDLKLLDKLIITP